MSSEDIIPERPELPEALQTTEAHVIMANMGLIPSQLERVPDLETGGTRSRRFGAWLGLNILPNINEQLKRPDAPLLLPEPPPVLLVADDLDTLRERVMFEVDVMIQTARDFIDGKIVINDEGMPVKVEEEASNVRHIATATVNDKGS